MKVAIYARYSTDAQDRTSIDGQYRNCEAVAAQSGYKVAAKFKDEAIGGGNDSRPGYRALLAAMEAREFDGIVVDETSRLTRSPGELPRLIEELAFRDQFLLAKDFDSRHETAQLMAGIYSGLDRMELQKIKARTHRGLRERHLGGFSAGGRTYGYTSEAVDPADPETRWNKVIAPEQAKWVTWIFEQYANGLGGKSIAAELNRLAVPSPGATWNRNQRRTDGKWQHSAILGMASRGSGILRNELYVGRVVWNRSEWVKRPGTGTRTYRLRPRDQWIIEDHPELRIIPDDLWDAVQARLSSKSASGKAKYARRGNYLLTGILKCIDCGGSLTMIDARCYGCGTRNRGGDSACDNGIRLRRADLEDRFLTEVREQLLSPQTIRWAEKEVARQLAAPPVDTSATRSQLAEVEAELARVVDAIAKVGLSPALESKLASLECRKRDLTAEVRAAVRSVDIPDAELIAATWHAAVDNLGELPKLAEPSEVEAARRSLQALIGVVRVDRDGKGYADISVGVPTGMVAGARSQRYLALFTALDIAAGPRIFCALRPRRDREAPRRA